MKTSLKRCKFEHTKLSLHFESFNDECAIMKEDQGANLLIHGIKTNACLLAAELESFKIDHAHLKTDAFSIP